MNDTPNNPKDIQTLPTNTKTNNPQSSAQDNPPNYPQNNSQIHTENNHNDINNTNQTFSARFHACIDMMAEISQPPRDIRTTHPQYNIPRFRHKSKCLYRGYRNRKIKK